MTQPRQVERLDRRLVVAGGIAGAVMGGTARAAPTFPARPLTIMAPSNPGGGTDQIARLIRATVGVEKLSPAPMSVINRGGAGGAIGLAELVSRHHGDPHIVMTMGGGAISAQIAQHSPFSILDTAPLARLTVEHLVVAVPAASPFRSIEDFLAGFRKDPQSVTWCGGSAGGPDHLLVALIAEACDVPLSRLRYIAYQGGGAASAALLGGQVTAGVNGFSEWRGLAEANRVRILAVASQERFGDKAIPVLQEAGLDVVQNDWRGVFAPPGLDAEHIAWWAKLIERMHASATWHDHLLKSGWEDGYLAQGEFVPLVRADHARYTATLARLGLAGTSGGYSAIGPFAVPAAIGVVGAAALGATIVERVRGRAQIAVSATDDEEGGGPLPVWWRLAAGAGLLLAYVVTLGALGFLVATPVFIFLLGVLVHSKRPILNGCAGIGLTAAIWLLFTQLLYVNLP